MQRVSTLLTERQTGLINPVHIFIADRTVVIRSWDTFLSSVRFGGFGRRGFADCFGVGFTNTSMGDGAGGRGRFGEDGLEFTGEQCPFEQGRNVWLLLDKFMVRYALLVPKSGCLGNL